MTDIEYDPESLIDLLPLYYKRLFPYDQYYKWLSYGCPEYLARREFSFTFLGDIYVRFESFDNQEQLMSSIQKKYPVKIDIGAIYNVRPKYHKRVEAFTVQEKEIVFDIDMTDYDEIRTCCSGASVCTKCWKFMVIACKVLDVALREDFGYTKLLWVFSGRRGIHCWVCDPAARRLGQRHAVAEYLTVIRGGEQKSKKVIIRGEQLHHSVARAYKIMQPYFEEICLKEQDLLGTEERVDYLLKLSFKLNDLETLRKDMLAKKTSEARWQVFTNHYKYLKDRGILNKNARHLIEEIVLQFLYPRLDVNVTKGMNHLLKSPFCVHPKSGKVSIPFNPATAEKFNPLTVPTISVLAHEINQFDDTMKKESQEMSQENEIGTQRSARIKDYKKTSLYKSILVFENFVRSLELIKESQLDF